MKQYLSLWPYATVNFFYYAILGGFVSYLAIMLTEKQFSSIEIGQVFAFFTLGRMFTGHLWANWADKYRNPKRFFQLGLLLSLLLLLPLYWVEQKQLVFYLVIAHMTAFWTVISQLEVLSLGASNGSATIYNRIRLFGSVGFIVAAIFIGWQIEILGANVIIWFASIVLSMQLILSTWLKNAETKEQHKANAGDQDDFWQRCLKPQFIAFLLASILLQMSFMPYVSFFTQYLSQSGYSGSEVGVLFALGTLSEIFMFMMAGRVLAKFGVKFLLVFCLAITALRWATQGYLVEVLPILILTQVIHAFSYGLMHSTSIYFIGQHFSASQQNRGQFMYLGVTFGLGGALGAWLTGITWNNGTGSLDTFVWASSAAFIATLLILITPRKNFQFLNKSRSV